MRLARPTLERVVSVVVMPVAQTVLTAAVRLVANGPVLEYTAAVVAGASAAVAEVTPQGARLVA
jgi:hypothetical protein